MRRLGLDAGCLRARLTHLKELERRRDPVAMAFALRAGLRRGLGGSSNRRLYNVSHVGTKHLVEAYIGEAVRLLRFVCDCADEQFELERRLRFFLETRHAFGRSALLLSGGGAFGYARSTCSAARSAPLTRLSCGSFRSLYHIGVVRALWEEGLLPQIVCGSSVGSIVASVMGAQSTPSVATAVSRAARERSRAHRRRDAQGVRPVVPRA
jgi:TAG lipase/steryl ester hydrolase/phospholipase A2/LPA acyltransferase